MIKDLFKEVKCGDIDKLEFMIYLVPGAKKELISEIVFDENQLPMLKTSVFTRPENNNANESLIKLLSKIFNVAKSKIAIKSGHKSRKKLMCVVGVSITDAYNIVNDIPCSKPFQLF